MIDQPFVLTSSADRQAWNYTDNFSISTNKADWRSVAYSTNAIVMAGWEAKEPLLLNSEDNGLTWSRSEINGVPEGIKLGFLNSVACFESICLAAGYSTSTPGNIYFLKSTDGGKTWLYTLNVFNAANGNNAFLNHKLLYGGNACIAYNINDFLATRDSGLSWSFQDFLSSDHILRGMTFSQD